MSNILIQPITAFGITAVSASIINHRVISGINAIPAVPAVEANPSATPPVDARDAIPGVDAVVGNVISTFSLLTDNGSQILSEQRMLTPEQYAAWDDTVIDDDAYFTACHLKNAGLALLL